MIICFRSINLQYILPSPSSGDQEGGGDQAGAAVHQGGGKEVRFEHPKSKPCLFSSQIGSFRMVGSGWPAQ